jgi:DHA1 family inner membrane transport protein
MSIHLSNMKNKETPLLLLLAAIQFTNILDFMIMMPMGKQIMEYYDISNTAFNFLVASYVFAAGISGIVAANFLDNFDRRNSLIFTYGGFLVGTFLCAIAPSFAFLVTARIFTGIFGGIIGAQILAIIADVVPFERRASAMGVTMASFSLASVIGVPMGIFISEPWGWKAPFFLIAGVGVLVWIYSFKMIPSLKSHLGNKRNKAFEIFSVAFRKGSPRIALIMMVIMTTGHFMVVPNIANFVQFNLGFSERELLLVYLIGGLVSLFTNPFVGKQADRFGKQKVFVIMVLLNSIPVLLLTNLSASSLVLTLCITAMFFAFSSGRFSPAQALITQAVEPRFRGSFMSFLSAMQQIGAGIGAVISGLVMSQAPDKSYIGFPVVGIISVSVGLMCLFFIGKIKPLPSNS